MPQLKTPEEYAELAEHFARARQSAPDDWSKTRLLMLEQSYRVLSRSVRPLEISDQAIPLQKSKSEK